MIKRLQLLCSIFLLCLIMSSCSRFIHSANGGFSDVSLNRNSDEYTLKRLDPIELSGSSLFGIPGFGTNNKNKNKYGMIFRFNGIQLGSTPRILPILSLAASTIALGGVAQSISGFNKKGDYNLPTGVNYLVAFPVAGIVNNLIWSGAATSGLTNQVYYKMASENPDIDIFINPKYQVDYKLGLFNQKASIKASVTGATLKIK
jgi:hypothetical protein